MRLHNTLTRKTSDFTPLIAGEVTLYTCGPTVYDYAHIGNLRAFLFYDLLRRSLVASDFKVKHVMNITDVGHLVSDADEGEDKLEKGALREGKSVWDVGNHYTEAFKSDVSALNILPPNGYNDHEHGDNYARATNFIAEQVDMVKLLLERGFAYQTPQAIYFDVSKIANYGELSGQKLADKEVGARSDVVTDPDKKHPYDFAVWFFAVGHFADHTMHWPTPWGDGFPGWHLECSAIIHATLGDPIDIHTGGIDHVGTHHPNEMAQTEAAFGHNLANFWMHNEFILVDGTKMSKSKGNSYTLADLTGHGFSPLAYRMLVLQAHYRSELNFSWESLEAAENTLLNIYAWVDKSRQQLQSAPILGLGEKIAAAERRIVEALQNDLGSPQALAHLFGLMEFMNPYPATTYDQDLLSRFVKRLEEYFGLGLTNDRTPTAEWLKIIQDRQTLRAAGNYEGADKLRIKLLEHGIEVKDHASGSVWRRVKV